MLVYYTKKMSLESNYYRVCNTPSDINEHLYILKDYTTRCSSVVECGVRSIVSSYAFAYGLKDVPNNKYYLVDPVRNANINVFLRMCETDGVNAEFFQQSDLDCPLVQTDLLFIDTWHVYGQLKRELARWHSSVSKYIIMHDTTVDEWQGETVRAGWNAVQQSTETGIPVDEINKGLWPAIAEFLEAHSEWTLEKRLTNNNGLTILKRV